MTAYGSFILSVQETFEAVGPKNLEEKAQAEVDNILQVRSKLRIFEYACLRRIPDCPWKQSQLQEILKDELDKAPRAPIRSPSAHAVGGEQLDDELMERLAALRPFGKI